MALARRLGTVGRVLPSKRFGNDVLHWLNDSTRAHVGGVGRLERRLCGLPNGNLSGLLGRVLDGRSGATPEAVTTAATSVVGEVQGLRDVVAVTPPIPSADGSAQLITVVPGSGPTDQATTDLVGAIRDAAGVSDSALSKQASALEEAGYVRIRKGYVGKRPRTWLQLTPRGHQALASHVTALNAIIARAGASAAADHVTFHEDGEVVLADAALQPLREVTSVFLDTIAGRSLVTAVNDQREAVA